jgi:tetrahydromethanopterin S-methyltransferase subunit B
MDVNGYLYTLIYKFSVGEMISLLFIFILFFVCEMLT